YIIVGRQIVMGVVGGIVILAVVVAVVYKLVQWERYRLPPGPRGFPIVGNLLDIGAVRFRCFSEWSKHYGPIMSMWFGATLNVIVCNTELAKEVLKEHDQQLADRPRSRSAEKFCRNGQDLIWADYGPHYVKVRKVCTLELFTPNRLESLRAVREDEVTAMVDSIFKDQGTGNSLIVKKYLSAVAFSNITRIAFGKRFVNEEGKMDPQGLEFKEIVGTGLKLGASLTMAEHIPYLRWMFPLEKGAFDKHGANVKDVEQLARNEPKCSVWHRVTPGMKLADEKLKFSSKAMEE
ncbi:hypothetical protein KI387_034339, partial [Taxus chinensis]